MIRVVRLSVCHMRISPKLSEIDPRLLGNSNMKPDFPIQNLSSDSQSEVQFRCLIQQHGKHGYECYEMLAGPSFSITLTMQN